VASEERMHAARVTAAEAEASRRVRERKQTRAEPARPPATAGRAARRELEAAEALVASTEQRVAAITGRLEDPALYTRDGGPAEAVRLGRELEEAKGALEAAFARWERASAAADAAG
jgi:hypothetical protein